MNNLIQIINNEPVTTSLALAEGTGNQHRAVLQLIRKYTTDLESFGGVTFKMTTFQTGGGPQKREVAILNEPQSTLLITYLKNTEIVRKFKMALVKGFFEARNKLANSFNPLSMSRAQILRLACESEEKNEQLTHQIGQNQPLVEFAQRHASATGSFTFTESAKQIGIAPSKFINWLHESGYIYKTAQNKSWLPIQAALNRNFFIIKAGSLRQKDGTEKATQQCRLTPKGVQHFERRLRRFELI